jgi:hypothetical protein
VKPVGKIRFDSLFTYPVIGGICANNVCRMSYFRKKVYMFEPRAKKGSWATLGSSNDAINRNEKLQQSSSRFTHRET